MARERVGFPALRVKIPVSCIFHLHDNPVRDLHKHISRHERSLLNGSNEPEAYFQLSLLLPTKQNKNYYCKNCFQSTEFYSKILQINFALTGIQELFLVSKSRMSLRGPLVREKPPNIQSEPRLSTTRL